MTLIQSRSSVLATLSGLLKRASQERHILPATSRDDMQDMHLAESYLISTPPLLFASQRSSML